MTIRSERSRVDDWNRNHPIGTRVCYWRGVRDSGPGREGKTESMAELLGGHTAVVWISGVAGCIALSHVEVSP